MKGGTTRAGEIYFKRAGAGFVLESGRVRVHDRGGPCMMGCGDDDCVEWDTCEEVDAEGRATGGLAYHVSECQLDERSGG